MNNRDRDIFFVGFVAYAEASDQGQMGIRAQCHSVVNRFKEKDWDARKTISATLFVPYAYSALNTEEPNRIRAATVDMDDPIMKLCMLEAKNAVEGISEDPTGGATHYYSPKVMKTPPNWVTGVRKGKQVAPPATFTVQIGDHRFYKEVE